MHCTISEQSHSCTSSHSQSRLRFYQKKAAPIANSFVPTTFRPFPLLTNCHLQTIGGLFLGDHTDCAYITDVGATIRAVLQRAVRGKDQEDWFYDERHRIDTPDGDFFHVDYKYGSNEGTIVLLHGLQSNSNSSLCIDLATAYHHRLNMNVACVNFRGCSGVPNDTIGGYHSGFTDDLKFFLSHLKETGHSSRDKPVYVSGVFLGVNVVVNALGELGQDAYEKYQVRGAALAGIPFDHERNSSFTYVPGLSRSVYSGSFVRSLQDRTKDQLKRHYTAMTTLINLIIAKPWRPRPGPNGRMPSLLPCMDLKTRSITTARHHAHGFWRTLQSLHLS